MSWHLIGQTGICSQGAYVHAVLQINISVNNFAVDVKKLDLLSLDSIFVGNQASDAKQKRSFTSLSRVTKTQ